MTSHATAAVLALRPATPHDRRDVLDLVEHACLVEPGYVPPVTDGSLTVAQWFDQKTPDRARVATIGSALVGYLAVQKATPAEFADTDAATDPRLPCWEASRLCVSPHHRSIGTATALIRDAHRVFGADLWSVCVTDSASHRLFARLGWVPFAEPWLSISRAPGVVLRAPEGDPTR